MWTFNVSVKSLVALLPDVLVDPVSEHGNARENREHTHSVTVRWAPAHRTLKDPESIRVLADEGTSTVAMATTKSGPWNSGAQHLLSNAVTV